MEKTAEGQEQIFSLLGKFANSGYANKADAINLVKVGNDLIRESNSAEQQFIYRDVMHIFGIAARNTPINFEANNLFNSAWTKQIENDNIHDHDRISVAERALADSFVSVKGGCYEDGRAEKFYTTVTSFIPQNPDAYYYINPEVIDTYRFFNQGRKAGLHA